MRSWYLRIFGRLLVVCDVRRIFCILTNNGIRHQCRCCKMCMFVRVKLFLSSGQLRQVVCGFLCQMLESVWQDFRAGV